MAQVYSEGRCRRCGMRVTVDRETDGHIRDGRACGPVETERPFTVPDDASGNRWMIPLRP